MDRSTSTSFQPVEDWLRNLGLLHFAQSFYDNGYEDIETCKQIGEEDLNVIGIRSDRDRNDILSAVKRMQQNLYFELEPEPTEKEVERQKFGTILLKSKLKDCLHKQNVQLIEPPYYNPDGSLGDLYPLAIRFAEELGTFFNDVLEALDQLRKRQLPVQAYDDITKLPTADASGQNNSLTDPAEYLNCETPVNLVRAHSFSKYDTRVTKSTTDLTKDLHDSNRNSQRSGKNKTFKKIDRNKSIFGNVFKKGKESSKSLKDNRNSGYDFNATEVTLSQNEIVSIFAKVKNNEMSQEDALAAIKKVGVTKSNSGGSRSEFSSASSPEALHNTHFKTRTGKLSKSMIKKTSPSAQFYTKDDDHHQSSSSLQSVDSGNSERQHERSCSLDVDMPPESIKSSPELGKPGLFKILRSSLRRKGRSDEIDDKGPSPSGSLSSQENVHLGLISEDFQGKVAPEDITFTTISQTQNATVLEQSFVQKPEKPALPPRPVRISTEEDVKSNAVTNTCSDEIQTKDRRPSLKIKSYEKYQEETARRRSQEKMPKPPPRQVKGANNNTCTSMEQVAPKPPPRPASKSSSGEKKQNTAIANNATKKSIHTSDIDEIGNDMKDLIAELNEDLSNLKSEEDTEEKFSSKDDVFHPETVTKRKKPLLPPRTKPLTKPNIPPNATNTDKKQSGEAMAYKESINEKDIFAKELTKSTMIIKNVSKELEKIGDSQKNGADKKSSEKTLADENNKVPVTIDKNNVVKKVSLKQIVRKKLRKEAVSLDNCPYTNADGSWNVPYALTERYSFELQQSLESVAKCFEEIRIQERDKKGLPVIPMKNYENYCSSRPGNDISLDEWLVHVGLPMFSEDLKDVEINTIEELSKLSKDSFKNIGVFDEKHVTLLLRKARDFLGYM